jgi:hypothetical protein
LAKPDEVAVVRASELSGAGCGTEAVGADWIDILGRDANAGGAGGGVTPGSAGAGFAGKAGF